MAEELCCYRCGTSLSALSLPLSRQDECPGCSVHLHVCRMCIFHDPNVGRQCREDDAEEVKEKERANFCDYFKPSVDVFTGHELAAENKARDGLSALFGDDDAGTNVSDDSGSSADSSAAEDLFK